MPTSDVMIEQIAAVDVDELLAERLVALTLPAGDMAKVFRACRDPHQSFTGHVVVARCGTAVVGWALRWRLQGPGRRWVLHLFVDPAQRRRGVATVLVAAARHRLRSDTTIRGCVHDDVSHAFWAQVTDPRCDAPDQRPTATVD